MILRVWLGAVATAALLLAWSMAAHAKCRGPLDTSRACDPNEFTAFMADPGYYRRNPMARQAAIWSCSQGTPQPAAWCRAAYQAARLPGQR